MFVFSVCKKVLFGAALTFALAAPAAHADQTDAAAVRHFDPRVFGGDAFDRRLR